jgi:hypothetical protein
MKKYDSSYKHLWVKNKSNLGHAYFGYLKNSSLTHSQGRAAKNACTLSVCHLYLSTAIKGNYCIHLLILFPKERTVACVIGYDVHSSITFNHHMYRTVVTIHCCQHHTVSYTVQTSVLFILITIISCQHCNILQEQTHTVVLKSFVVENLYVSDTCIPIVGSLTVKRAQVLGGCPSKCICVILIITAIYSCLYSSCIKT